MAGLRQLFFLLLTVFFFLAACRDGSPVRTEIYREHTVRIYENTYEDGLLVKTTVTAYPGGDAIDGEFEPLAGQQLFQAVPEEEYLYFYEDGELVRVEEYILTRVSSGVARELYRETTYGPDRVEERTGSYGYDLKEYESGMLVRHTSRKREIVPGISEPMETDRAVFLVYDDRGRVAKSITVDNAAGVRTAEYRFYGPVPEDAVIEPGAEVVSFRDSIGGDTVYTIRSVDGRPERIYKTVDREDYRLKITEEPSGELILREEVFRSGGDSVEVVFMPEFGTTDSTFYSNGLETGYRMDSPAYSLSVSNRYDEYGNLMREERIEIIYEDDEL